MADNNTTMKDLIGRDLTVGCNVAFAVSGQALDIGRITQFTKKMVRVEYRGYNGNIDTVLRYPVDLSLLEGPPLIEYLLKNGG